ncbi:40S ribosomal protein S12 [Trypanosoma grayi]|uniref:40S ribosomal protein S12 n=1 Tax=Trypanosoma grayi TaxID=71804 RepID=UPI0004F47A88|nr:40S ribosomal protein S12 [Trypanosoma grayi]KEG07717.1 40S ribosomal protein S12 [Trypanosoma grayi]
MVEETPVVDVAPVVVDAVMDATPESLEDALRIVLQKSREANGLIRGLSEVVRALDRRALRIVLQKSREANGLIRGLSEVVRALDRRTAHLCVLADDCEDEEYKKLITALAKQGVIDLINVEEREKLAQWAGLAKIGADGEVKKTFKCSCVAVRDFGERTRALDFLLSHLR